MYVETHVAQRLGDSDRIEGVLADVHRAVRPLVGVGNVCRRIPELSTVDVRRFGMAVATVGGDVLGVGDCAEPFSIQSLSKIYSFAMVLAADGERVWRRVNREPSIHPFDSVLQLELDRGIPRNPFVNAGALVITDRLQSLTGDALTAVRDFLRAESGNPELRPYAALVESELGVGHRNAALAHTIAGFGNLDNPVNVVLDHYVRHCALAMSCTELAAAAAFLARGGNRADGGKLLSASATKRLNATLMVAGTYDCAGDFAYRVGLPAKSGIGGGIVAIVPGRCALCVWSPGLDGSGNSVAGVAALEVFTSLTGLSVF